MKSLILPALLLVVLHTTEANEKSVKSTVKNVTVFLQGAQVYRTSAVNLSPGMTDLVFSSVSPFVNPTSIQAGGKGDFTILEVKHKIKYPEPETPKESVLPAEVIKELKLLEDSLIELGFAKGDVTDKKTALLMEKDMIVKNKLSQGEGKSDSLPILKQAMEFFRVKLTDINNQLGKIKREENRLTVTINKVTERLNVLKTYKNNEDPKVKYEPIHQIIVSVSADAAVTGTVDINYMVSQAGWSPTYDLRSTTVMQPVQLTYKANVFQNSKEDWNNVKLKLSTSNPNRNNIKPELPPWYINYYTNRQSLYGAAARPSSRENLSDIQSAESKKDEQFNNELKAKSPSEFTSVIETMANVIFDINLPYNIPSDGTNHLVSIKTVDLPATYYHYLVPKIESEAFLIARITGWENVNLLPGRANVFYEGTFVGETTLNPGVINDTLDLAFGRDNGITVTRTKLPVKESNKLLGNEITKTIVYELKMKNNKSKTLNLIVEDQIPMSQNNEIKVEMIDNGKAEYNKQTGLLKWNFAMNSKDYKSLKFSYEVTYNKDKPLSMF